MHLLPYAVHRAVSALNYPATCNPAGCKWKNDEFSLFLPMKISYRIAERIARERIEERVAIVRNGTRVEKLG